MAPPVRLGTMTRFMIALGAKRHRLERELGIGSARFIALHPDSLAQILRLGEHHFRGNSRSFVELVGLEFVADDALARGYIEVRPAHRPATSALVDPGAPSPDQARRG